MNKKLSYEARIDYCRTNIAKKIFKTMDHKKSNLCLAADVTHSSELLALAETLGPYICILKTHIDIIEDFTPSLTKRLRELADQYHFILFEDRKFADIGNTVKAQYQGGMYRIADWADIVNAHSLPGSGIIKGLGEVDSAKERGIILIAEMSSAGHLLDQAYQETTLRLAEQYPDAVIGFITRHALSQDPKWINLTPGISLSVSNDTLGQRYHSPKNAIIKDGTDVIIVGRSIISAPDPIAEAKQYREAGWDAYLQRLS